MRQHFCRLLRLLHVMRSAMALRHATHACALTTCALSCSARTSSTVLTAPEGVIKQQPERTAVAAAESPEAKTHCENLAFTCRTQTGAADSSLSDDRLKA
jgi:hypothetical protein